MSAQPRTTTPLTSAQRGLWLLDELHPGSSLYNVFCSVRLTGPLDRAALRRAFDRLVARHEVLRTAFPAAGGEPVPVVAEPAPVELPVLDLARVPAAERFDRACELVDAWAERPFDLAEGPLFRALLVALDDGDHLLGVAAHHIVSDGRSLNVVFDELALLYAGEEPGAPPAQYADYAVRQRARAEDPELSAWWVEHLRGAPDVLSLPSDRPRPAVRGVAGATHLFDVPGELTAFCSAHRVSPFMLLMTAWAVLLGRLADVDEVLVGTPVSDRPGPEFDGVVGLFVDTVPVRVDLSGNPAFGELLGRVRGAVLDAVTHQGVPFDRIVALVGPDRAPSHTPLVQNIFSADLAPLVRPRFPGLTAELRTPAPTTAKFDLDLTVQGGADGPVGVLTYSTELFDPGTAERIGDRFARLLLAGTANPETPIRHLPLLDDDELTTILGTWHETAPAAPPDLLVHELFGASARRTPDAPALDGDGGALTYRELDERSTRLARAVAARPDEVVGVLVPRGTDLIVALLAVLKSGGAYLPLSPTHPPAYLARVLDAAGATRVVAADELAHRLTGVEVIPPGRGLDDGELPRVHPDQLAYVLYTSGSTGEPKGVAVTHRALANVARTMVGEYDLTPADRVLQFANIGFDIAAEELYTTWTAGGCVVLAPDPPPGPDGLVDLMRDRRITFTILTSSNWRQWANAAWARGAHPGPALRLVSIGAEPVDRDTLHRWQAEVGVPVINIYGLTESTINATIVPLDGPVGDTVPVGVPLAGVTAYVLDRELEPVPVGVPGQLYLGGDCLARGYLGRADLTADRFVPHPFAPGARLHRTGDRARWRADGQLEVLGRLDKQLKVRGYRIEPGHVEAALSAHPDVRDAVVVARDERLVAYLVPAVPDDVRDHLAARLPVHLVPGAFVAVDAIPLNANGKVDEKALPVPTTRTAGTAAASTDLERELAALWREALGLDRVGVHDNFFELGGSSLTLAAVHRAVRDRLGRALPVVALYEYPTIAALARHLSGGAATTSPRVARPRPRRPRRR
ncbi:non-ribosomal peptide synthetase [Saccharothrix syringae]|uniref:Non-ribosomal peptide synthetase n=1 Tax=Saccharothrix syringae TaxID=103733 RepID=A0A5Q0H5U9_SACSY|nr:non-ribosomal peptide synthetase [Saccharothrix syringae]QFZ21132.1 non-ribosomal peptide synthetase [Saccharothrix syringae]